MSSNKRELKVKYTKGTPPKKTDPFGKDIIYDPDGQLEYPGMVTRVPGGDITMKGVPYPVLGIADTGEEQMMYPGEDYEFEGAEYITEYPKGKRPKKAKNGVNQADENSLVQLDQLTNFTNYNKPTKGGWLDKYQEGGKKGGWLDNVK